MNGSSETTTYASSASAPRSAWKASCMRQFGAMGSLPTLRGGRSRACVLGRCPPTGRANVSHCWRPAIEGVVCKKKVTCQTRTTMAALRTIEEVASESDLLLRSKPGVWRYNEESPHIEAFVYDLATDSDDGVGTVD